MLTTEPLDTVNIVDVLADLSIPFDYLTNSDTDADSADLYMKQNRKFPSCFSL